LLRKVSKVYFLQKGDTDGPEIEVDRDTPMLMPHDMRDWLPDDHIVYFIIDTVEMMDLSGFKVNHRGSGSEQYDPSMMLTLLIYSYITGTFHSRKIEQATYHDIASRYICGGNLHPDHDTICTFRRENSKAFSEAFTQLLCIASEVKAIRKVGTVSVDGTKVKAAASKHRAVSYKRANQPVFGIIKEAMGFRRFSLRGLEKVNTEWTLVSLSYNIKRLFSITGGKLVPVNQLKVAQNS